MGFSKKVVTENAGSGTSSGDWDTYNKSIWDAYDVDAVTDAKGREVKSSKVIGKLSFIMEMGCQPQAHASMKSNLPVPAEGVDNSPEELARLVDFPNNWFIWDDEWKDGKKTTVRKVCWDQDPQETLVLAADFPSIQVDYGLHPMSTSSEEDKKPLRVDYNGKFKGVFERTVPNEVHWKDGKFGDKDIKYAITSAIGNLKEYQEDGHDLSYLVDAICNWDLVMTKNVSGDKTYYNTKIKAPTAIQDIKVRKDVYTVEQQIEDNKCDSPFCGILFDAPVDEYEKADLQQVRTFWLEQVQKAVEFDKNAGTARDGEWLKGMNYADSGLAEALKKHGLDSTDKSPVRSEAKKVVTQPKKIETDSPEPEIDFDDK